MNKINCLIEVNSENDAKNCKEESSDDHILNHIILPKTLEIELAHSGFLDGWNIQHYKNIRIF